MMQVKMFESLKETKDCQQNVPHGGESSHGQTLPPYRATPKLWPAPIVHLKFQKGVLCLPLYFILQFLPNALTQRLNAYPQKPNGVPVNDTHYESQAAGLRFTTARLCHGNQHPPGACRFAWDSITGKCTRQNPPTRAWILV